MSSLAWDVAIYAYGAEGAFAKFLGWTQAAADDGSQWSEYAPLEAPGNPAPTGTCCCTIA